MQTRRGSLVEATINTAIGFVVSFVAQLAIYPAYGASFTLSDNIQITCLFTILSIVRGYAVRRWFNGYIHSAAMAISHEKDLT